MPTSQIDLDNFSVEAINLTVMLSRTGNFLNTGKREVDLLFKEVWI